MTEPAQLTIAAVDDDEEAQKALAKPFHDIDLMAAITNGMSAAPDTR